MADIVVVCGVESMSHVPMASQIPLDADGKAYLGDRYTDRYKELYDPTNQLEGAERIASKILIQVCVFMHFHSRDMISQW